MFRNAVRVQPRRVVAEGIISNPEMGDGRPIPVVLIDTAGRPEIVEYIAVHEYGPPGDVKLHWGTLRFSNRSVALILTVIRPIQTEIAIEFPTKTRYGLVDAILHANCFYLQAGTDGDRFSQRLEEPKIIIEVPDTGFRPQWNKILRETLMSEFKKNGLTKKEARQTAEEHIAKMREFWALRRPLVIPNNEPNVP